MITDAPVPFRRPRGILPLPEPIRGGSISELRPFVNVASDDDFVLVVTWELAALRPRGPYPPLVIIAEQGATKTTMTRILRRLSDPNGSDVRRPPRNTEDLMISATNEHVVAYDNLSRLSEDLSDNLSVLATGGGFAVRQLYTNAEECIFTAQRPIILNGISQIATRGDLLDRAIVITLPPISDEQRKDEATFWREFEQAHPRILGALLDAVVIGLQRVDCVHIERKPRMADFAMWGVATEAGCPWAEGTFLQVYAGNRQGAVEAMLEGDPIADVALKMAPWDGTATEMLAKLNALVPENLTKQRDWITRPRQVSDALRRLAPGLRRIGVDVAFTRSGHGRTRLIKIRRLDASASSAGPCLDAQSADEPADAAVISSASASAQNPKVYRGGDDRDDADAEKQHLSNEGDDELAIYSGA